MISSCGRVMNITTFKVLKPGLVGVVGKQYLAVLLCKNRIKKSKKIHKLVADAFILNLENLRCVDHIDRDKINNRLSNLRWVSCQQNNQNRSKLKNTSSMHKGVHFHKKAQKWVAYIMHNYHRIHLGYFLNEADAAFAYNRKAYELFGEDFAVLNV